MGTWVKSGPLALVWQSGEISARRCQMTQFLRPNLAAWDAVIQNILFDIVFSAVVCAILALPVAVLCLLAVLDSPGAPFSAKSGSA